MSLEGSVAEYIDILSLTVKEMDWKCRLKRLSDCDYDCEVEHEYMNISDLQLSF